MDDRYQFQPWHVRLWRRRHLILVPWVTLQIKLDHPQDPWGLAWSVASGLAHCKMKWVYTWDETWDEDG